MRIIYPPKRKRSLMERANSPWLCLIAVTLFIAIAVASIRHAEGGYTKEETSYTKSEVKAQGQLIDREKKKAEIEERKVALVTRLMGELYPVSQ